MSYVITLRNPFNGKISGQVTMSVTMQYFDKEANRVVVQRMVAKEVRKYFPHSSVHMLCKETDREWILDENFRWKEK